MSKIIEQEEITKMYDITIDSETFQTRHFLTRTEIEALFDTINVDQNPVSAETTLMAVMLSQFTNLHGFADEENIDVDYLNRYIVGNFFDEWLQASGLIRYYGAVWSMYLQTTAQRSIDAFKNEVMKRINDISADIDKATEGDITKELSDSLEVLKQAKADVDKTIHSNSKKNKAVPKAKEKTDE